MRRVAGRGPVLALGPCVVRPWRMDDARPLAVWADNPRVAAFLRDRFPHPYTLADARQWIRIARAADPATHFAIDVEGQAVGGVGFHVLDDIDRRTAEIGYWIAEPFWGRGIATAALEGVTDYAFQRFDLARIQARVFEGNEASRRVLEKAGYTFEACLRRSVTKQGRTIDSYLYARVREEEE